MQSPEYYVGQVKKLALEHNQHFQAITADGVIDYGEALNTRELLAKYIQGLQEVKRQAAAEIDALRHQYGEKMLVAQQQLGGKERAQALYQLRQEEQRAIETYERVINRIDFLQVGIPQNQQLIETHIAALEAEMNAVLDALPDVQFEAVDHFDPVREALLRVVRGWQALLDNIAQRADDPQLPQQNAYDSGVERALTLAISDVRDVIAQIDQKPAE